MIHELYERTGKPALYRRARRWCCTSYKASFTSQAITKEGAYLRWLDWVIVHDTQKIKGIEKKVMKYRNKLFADYYRKGVLR